MTEQRLDTSVSQKIEDLNASRPFLDVNPVGTDRRKHLLAEVREVDELPEIGLINRYLQAADFSQLTTLLELEFQAALTPEKRMTQSFLFHQLQSRAASLDLDTREMLVDSMQSSLIAQEADAGLTLLALDTIISLSSERLPDEVVEFIDSYKDNLDVIERVYIAKRLKGVLQDPEVDLILDIQLSPEEIFQSRHALKPGEVRLVAGTVLSGNDLESLLAITTETNREVWLYYDSKLDSYVFAVGNQYGILVSGKYQFINQLLDDMVVDLHTHPIGNTYLESGDRLLASDKDTNYWSLANPLSRHFIGMHPAPKRGVATNKMRFREFSKSGEIIHEVGNSTEMANVLNQTIASIQ